MKRIIAIIITFIIITVLLFSNKLNQYKKQQYDIQMFNKVFLEFDKDKLYGTNITTVINKAIDNNEQYNVKKDSEGYYIPDDKYSTKIYINLQEEGSIYPMERLYQVGIKEFTTYFGELNFKCTKVNYHENGRVSEMFFQATNNN